MNMKIAVSFGGTTCGIFTSDTSFFLNNFIYLYTLAMLGLHCCVGFSLVWVSRDSSLVAVHGLLIAVASLGAQALGSCSTWAS